ncbi:MAG: hypothetical protein PHG65_04300, partial [Kiritimatiellae bacterium]|nr:hypothetical protein [Kiritimatiellia bacterium]
MNTTVMWIETVILICTGIMVMPVLLDAARNVAGTFAGYNGPVFSRGVVWALVRQQRDPRGGRIWLKLCQWR